MIIHVFISRGLDNDTYRNLICFLFDYFYLHVYFIVDKETKHMVGNGFGNSWEETDFGFWIYWE